ncbi:hypothetical protein EXIGLDRAFT_434973 [Exidia glandulosa HHB12029]|uniref:Uncharacterized protein n=1 Tax=Exidia glandulosa HHB12029 TaxID=1314781 RepID=A0A165KFK8_EXIGL|nr:hypothetical protein EXIGLDRAFT_434973 [Exidia glandulosa HHB12029]
MPPRVAKLLAVESDCSTHWQRDLDLPPSLCTPIADGHSEGLCRVRLVNRRWGRATSSVAHTNVVIRASRNFSLLYSPIRNGPGWRRRTRHPLADLKSSSEQQASNMTGVFQPPHPVFPGVSYIYSMRRNAGRAPTRFDWPSRQVEGMPADGRRLFRPRVRVELGLLNAIGFTPY